MGKTYIILTKVKALPDRPVGTLETLDNWTEINVDYTIKGYYEKAPTIMETFKVVRLERNGVQMLGDFETSFIKAFDTQPDGSVILTTENSVYIMKDWPEGPQAPINIQIRIT
jgi:hypothetical protein